MFIDYFDDVALFIFNGLNEWFDTNTILLFKERSPPRERSRECGESAQQSDNTVRQESSLSRPVNGQGDVAAVYGKVPQPLLGALVFSSEELNKVQLDIESPPHARDSPQSGLYSGRHGNDSVGSYVGDILQSLV